ncbi:MAG: class I SAM-dependent methyltransferase [Fimbriimonadaceae bacterium]|nr:class I SAM-dependent methyltransferase [Fimbriimonadaceae bacterium]
MNYTPMTECLACGSADMQTYLDLGVQPLANSYHDGSKPLETFPLGVNRCKRCWHSQLTVAVDPDLMFKEYLYVSGTTATLVDYFKDFVQQVEQRQGSGMSVLDIASNDGSLLEQFLLRGHTVLGVDPAENLANASADRGVPTQVDYWSPELANSLGPSFDTIIAMNVLGHVASPLEFLTACKAALKPGGNVYIQTSQSRMVVNGEFDTIYHEHHSFFTAKSFRELAHRAGFSVVGATRVPVHGSSYLWTLAEGLSHCEVACQEMIDQEEADGFYDPATYERFADKVRRTAQVIHAQIAAFRRQGYRVIGYGAAAKANTFLNYAGLDLDGIIDDNPLKVGLKTPGRNIPILPSAFLPKIEEPLAVVMLAWNFAGEIMKRVAAQRPNAVNDVFFQYFPDPKICQNQPLS